MKISHAPLPHFDRRPPGTKIDTLVLHSIYVPEHKDRYSVEACLKSLDRYKVAAHYLISRRGKVFRLVDDDRRAWHAGVSTMPFPDDTRENVNQFSIGIELVGAPDDRFTPSQYRALVELVGELCQRHPITAIVGHDAIAPGRKIDPGAAFDWSTFSTQLTKALKKRKKSLPRMRLLDRKN